MNGGDLLFAPRNGVFLRRQNYVISRDLTLPSPDDSLPAILSKMTE